MTLAYFFVRVMASSCIVCSLGSWMTVGLGFLSGLEKLFPVTFKEKFSLSSSCRFGLSCFRFNESKGARFGLVLIFRTSEGGKWFFTDIAVFVYILQRKVLSPTPSDPLLCQCQVGLGIWKPNEDKIFAVWRHTCNISPSLKSQKFN